MSSYIRIPLALAAVFATLMLAGGAVLAGAFQYLAPSLPEAEELRDVRLQVPLSVYSRDGRLIAQMGEKKRIPVAFEDIPEALVQAFLAAEDDRFFDHPGVDYQGIARAALSYALSGEVRQGGSTITQQLARNFFLTPEKTVVRKAREFFLALKIEQAFSKSEILDLYLNKIFLGQRAFGVGAAAQVYFGKDLGQLSLAEMATIAGLPKAPSRDNPVRSPERAEGRRAYVLRRMLEVGYIDRAAHDAAAAVPMLSKLHGPEIELDAPYVAEMVRSEMLDRVGPAVYTSGFRVTTTVDSRLQRSANAALERALLSYDRRHGYRGPVERVELPEPAGGDVSATLDRLLVDYPEPGGLVVGVVTAVEEETASVHTRRYGTVELGWDGLAWAKRFVNPDVVGDPPERAADVLAAGDVVYVAPGEDDAWRLAQIPEAQGALVALDPRDGGIAALAGGFDFFLSKYNRVAQARRQPGSAFKPFVYSAALENGFTAASVVNDAPVVMQSAELEDVWRPENYSRRFNGPTRLREALARSLNLVSVRVLRQVGIGPAVDHLGAFGFDGQALPGNLSLALGAGVVTPLELASGYAVFANGGYRIEPYLIERIEESDGTVIHEAEPAAAGCAVCEEGERLPPARSVVADALTVAMPAERSRSRETGLVPGAGPGFGEMLSAASYELFPPPPDAPRVISPQNAWLVTDMMRDVITRGTGRRAYRELQRDDIAGKTGTSNDRRDAWFSGFNPDLVATAWVGFDQERTLGAGEEGGRTALPMWTAFMTDALAGMPERNFPRPDGLVEVRISPESGLVASAGDPEAIFETFQVGRVPPADLASLPAAEDSADEDAKLDQDSLF